MDVRTGAAWDALAVVALALPFIGLAMAFSRSPDRRSMAAAGRIGAFGAAALWVVAVAAGAAPEVGPLEPEPLAMAAAAGAALLATAQTSILAAPLAAGIGLFGCLVSPPSSASWAHVAAGSAIVVVAVLVPAPGKVLLAGGLLVGLRGAVAGDPADAVGLALVLVAASLVLLDARGLRLRRGAAGDAGATWATAALGVGTLAVATAPVPEARDGAVLLAAAAVLLAATGWRWALLGVLPGAAVTATALADLPAVDPPSPAVHVAFAVLLTVVGAGVVAGAFDGDRPVETRVAAGALAAWLALAPSSWSWAVPDPERLVAWDRAAAVAAAAATVTIVADQGRRRARQ